MNRLALLSSCLAATSVLSLVSSRTAFAQDLPNVIQSLTSPDGSLEVAFALDDGVPSYSVTRFGGELVRKSRLGFLLEGAPSLDGNFELSSASRCSLTQKWEQPWGEKREIDNTYNELRIVLQQQDDLGRELVIEFRVYDDGVGFRYEWPEQPNLKELVIQDELTEFALAEDCSVWSIPAYEPEHYEYLYKKTKVSEINKAHTPATFETAESISLSIHEAALVDFASMSLVGNGTSTLKADLAPWSDGVKVRATVPHRSPWRTIQVGDNPGELITSHLILNLNEPCQLADTSWIKPGKYIGIWWEMHLGQSTWGSGEKHGATTANTKRYIDFAADNGFDGVLVEGWNKGWDGDWTKHGDGFRFTEPYPDFDLPALAHYAESKGVHLIGHHETGGAVPNYERQMNEALKLYESLGVTALKTGYVNWSQGLQRIDDAGKPAGEWHYGQYMVRHHQHVIEQTAKHKIMLDVHEPVKPTGLCRTYPNLMSGEGARGQEYNAWSADGGNPPEHETILPFTRLLAGPMDFTPGIFDVTYEELRPNNRVNTTLARQLALYVVIYSPLQMAADLPENYLAHPDAFQFIRDVPTDWEDTRVLDARIGDYVTIARKARDGDDWFLGSITDEVGRSLETPLSFLDRDKTYVAEIYRDANDANWKSNPTAYQVEQREVDANTVLTLRLAPGGGIAIRFRPLAK